MLVLQKSRYDKMGQTTKNCVSSVIIVRYYLPHKNASLAAQTFMLSMAAVDYDTCPMEGTDTLRIKKLLNLPYGAEINMVVLCGIRIPEGIFGKRFRIPFDEVYKKL